MINQSECDLTGDYYYYYSQYGSSFPFFVLFTAGLWLIMSQYAKDKHRSIKHKARGQLCKVGDNLTEKLKYHG